MYGDVVHRSGFAETVGRGAGFAAAAITGNPLMGDDAGGVRGESPDGARIVWDRDAAPLVVKKAEIFLVQAGRRKDGQPVRDAELYMGMVGHAAFVKNDGTVFAHVHPSGSVPMAALVLANPSAEGHDMQNMSDMRMRLRCRARHQRKPIFPTVSPLQVTIASSCR